MRRLRSVAGAFFVAMTLGMTSGGAFADQDRHDHDHHEDHGHMEQHAEGHRHWHRGDHMDHDDWDRGEHVDYREHHLRRPPDGYEWRVVDGNYVLAAVATGIIASIIAASQH